MAGRGLFLVVCGLFFAGCPALYTTSPRYGRKKPGKPSKPVPVVAKHPLEGKKGELPWPVSGTVVGKFGVHVEPKYGTRTKNLGIDISCKRDSPVKAIWMGTVSYADVFIGQGLMVILEHGGGYYSVYSRLEEINVSSGQKVESGHILGLSGDVLHFELRVGGIAVDPAEWLERR
ncbi:MAG: murein hydrolase activator EnvC family protein [bacterium]